MPLFSVDREHALELDQRDPLARFRRRFYLLPEKIYMDGNSLGLLSRDAEDSLMKLLTQWKGLGIDGWMAEENPWFSYPEELGRMQAPLVGAEPDEVVVTASTTVNLHTLVGTFYRPEGRRTRILGDELNFPSDIYALKSQIRLKGLDPEENLLLAKSRDGRFLWEEDIIKAMDDTTALILLPSVLYRSGQLLDMEGLSREAGRRNIPIGFDCSHSVGALPHRLHEWGVDFAFWCNYKYMNSGPGGTASLYVHKKHFSQEPALAGWWGCRKDRQFDMSLRFEKAAGAGGWQIGTPQLLSAAPLEGSLRIFQEAGIERLREKSLNLTSYLMSLVQELKLTEPPYNYRLGTPMEESRRGGHVAVEHRDAARISRALKARGIIPDFRPPNVVRLAPMALYTTYLEVWQVVRSLQEIIDKGEHQKYANVRDTIA